MQAWEEKALEREEGRLEERQEIVINMLKSGIPESEVARLSEQSLEEVIKLAHQNL